MAGTVSWVDADDVVWMIGPSGGGSIDDDEGMEFETVDEDSACSVVCRSLVV